MSARLGKMMCPVKAGRECLPVSGARKRFCAHVATGLCAMRITELPVNDDDIDAKLRITCAPTKGAL